MKPTVQHARVREQFGRPVVAFQAVAHLCAGVPVRTETARAAAYAAAVTAVTADPADVTTDPADAAAARLLADEAAVRGAREHGLHLGLRGPSPSEARTGSNPPCGLCDGE